MTTLYKDDKGLYYCKNCKGTPKSVYQAEGMSGDLLFCSGCWKGPVEKVMKYYLKCPCGATGVASGYYDDSTNATEITSEIEWEGGINDDFDPLLDNKNNLCSHDDYVIEDEDYENDHCDDYTIGRP
jgi:hypothetical protein